MSQGDGLLRVRLMAVHMPAVHHYYLQVRLGSSNSRTEICEPAEYPRFKKASHDFRLQGSLSSSTSSPCCA